MSKPDACPIDLVQRELGRHEKDARAALGDGWLAQVVEILRTEAATVPPPVHRDDVVPKYVYPH